MPFASIHVPNFMVQASTRGENHSPKSAIALIDGAPPLITVVAANEAAMRAGIQLGMAKLQAELFAVEIRLRSRVQEKTAHAALLDLGWSISPRIEDQATDTIIADVSGLASLIGSHKNIAGEIMQRAGNLGLYVHVAIAANPEAALHAARGFPGITLIPPGEEEKHLSVLPLHALSPSAEALETLDRWGIRTCQALAALPILQLSERLGQEGVRLHERARGATARSIVLAEPEERTEEELELEDAVADLEPLSFLLGRLLDQMCARLQTRSLAASAIRLKFDLGDLFEKTEPEIFYEDSQLHAPRTQALSAVDDKKPEKTYHKVLHLPVPMRDSKMLLKLLRLQLQSDPPRGSIVKIFLSADTARPRTTQGGLFIPSSPDPEKLELTVARLAKLVGNANIGSPELVDTHRPGEFRMKRFMPELDDPKKRAKMKTARKKPVPDDAASASPTGRLPFSRPATGYRIFRPSLPAKVEVDEGCPAKVFFRGLYGRVVAASGPWRASGDWWQENSWRQDEWDLEIHFRSSNGKATSPAQVQKGLYCVYYDSSCQSWFVRGMYD
jgi:protein ImuB